MYTKILVPLDGSPLSEKILPSAQLLAGLFHATIELLQVIDTADIPESDAYDLEQNARRYLERVAATLGDVPATQCRASPGNPAAVIVDTAAADPETLIAIATQTERNAAMRRLVR